MGDFVIGIVGGFSGSRPASGERGFRDVDRDDFDRLLADLTPRVETGLAFCPEILLSEWAHFHPDELARRVPALSKLLDAREEVGNPRLMRRLIEDSGVDVDAVAASAAGGDSPAASPAEAAPPRRVSEGDLLDSILEGGPDAGPVEVVAAKSSADPEFDAVIAEIVEASADRTDYAQQDRWRDAIDREIAARMRAILHAPAFQQLDASWRSLRSLVMGVETSEALRIRLLDVSADALRADLAGGERSALLEAPVVERERAPGGMPFGLLVFDYALGPGEDDAPLLAALAGVAGRAGAPAVAGLAPCLWADGDLDWEGLEQLATGLSGAAGADRLGLVLPRLLLRLPFGPDTDPIDRFAFDEAPAPGTAQYLWGNGGYALAFAAAEAFTSLGRVAAVAKFGMLEGLPFHAARHGVEVESVGPTDRLLSDAEIERVAELGLVPLAGFRGRDTAFVARFQSVTGASLFPD